MPSIINPLKFFLISSSLNVRSMLTVVAAWNSQICTSIHPSFLCFGRPLIFGLLSGLLVF
ncbi:hypothetical protein HanIR_Chr15g0740661 [Helianthus annuus]|nr:hypothetical protein HanIR_Chr15g0740661 [Helianthus annuus]